jgi:putative methyltransferase
MRNPTQKTVLISEPQGVTGALQFDNSKPYLPYIWAILKSYWERHGPEVDQYEWLEPIWRNAMPALLLEPYRGLTIDVLGLSCYTWNWEVQCGIAQQVKAGNSNCLVVVGGPEPDHKDSDFFHKHPYIDVIVVKDGEITFNKLLSKVLRNSRDFQDIGGLYLPGGDEHIMTGLAEVPKVFEHSPYVDQSNYYQRLTEHYGSGSFDAIIETNRGCPYGCSFCDWGSSTMSQIRRFDMGKIEAEIDWLGRMRVGRVMLADANFGILPRDVEIADLLNTTREKHQGYPRHIFYSAAKNHPDRVVTIAKKFAQSGICTSHALSIQHTRKQVLAATERTNISPEKQVQVVKTMMESRVPVEVQLILGIPGDSYDLWKACLADLMEWGIHEDYLIQAYRLLPNAPAAEKSFIDNWKIETIGRVMFDHTVRSYEKSSDVIRMRERIVVQSKTYSRKDWVKMSTYAAFIKGLHNSSLTQRIAVYLRLTHNVSYLEFYEHLIEEGLQSAALPADWYQLVSDHYHSFLEDQGASDHMEVKELPRLSYALHPSRWIYVQICLNMDQFFDALQAYLVDQYPGVGNLRSVVEYQKELMILPNFDRDVGKRFRTDFDWISYFEEARVRDGSETLGEPIGEPGAMVTATDRTSSERGSSARETSGRGYYGAPLEWAFGDIEDRWIKWIERTVTGRSSASMHNFQQLRIDTPQGCGSRRELAA